MEKKKHKKLTTTASNQDPNSNNHLGKEEQNQSNEALAAKNTKSTASPSQENFSSLNEQYSQILQWPYTTPQAAENSSLGSRSLAPSQLTLPSHVSGWQQVATLQPNSPNQPIQQGQPTLHLAQSSSPFWLPQRPSFQYPGGVSVHSTFQQPFTSIPTVDATWQPSAIIGGTTPRIQHQVPNLLYHFGPYPGYPGPCDPSSWWAHGQQSQPSFNYTFPEAYGYISAATPPMPNCSVTFGESSQRGIIRPVAKLSQKHQQLWEAQSIENVQLWSVINQLQSEVADYKSRLTKLEAEISSLKPSIDKPSEQVIQTGRSGPASKRGRPKRPVASIHVSALSDESDPRARVRKPAATKVQLESKTIVFEKVALNKLEDRQKTAQSNSSTQKDNGEKIPFSSFNLEVNGSNLSVATCEKQVHQEAPGIEIHGIDSVMKINGHKVDDDSEDALSILSQVPKVKHMGGTNGETLTWHASFHPEEQHGRTIYNAMSQTVIPGWSFVNEEDVSDHELEDHAVAATTKDENEEEMEDEGSSGEELDPTKDDHGAYRMDAAVGTSPKDLPQYNNW